MFGELLDIAADQILAGGITAITNRSVSAVAATSTSTIAYHWPDMRHFVLDAVWHSVFRDMPGHLAGHTPDGDPAGVNKRAAEEMKRTARAAQKLGVSVVNALSERLDLEIWRNGQVHQQSYERGHPLGELEAAGTTKRRGTKVTFKPDSTIFETTLFSFDTLAQRLRELAFLNAGIVVTLDDEREALVTIRSGAGGVDAADWAEMLLRMYTRYCERHGWPVEVYDTSYAEEAGIKSCTFAVHAPYAYGTLSIEQGTHRLVRISPFDGNARRQTSFAEVEVIPELPRNPTGKILKRLLREKVTTS